MGILMAFLVFYYKNLFQFQFGLTSGLVGGVGRDAKFVVNHLIKSKKDVFLE
jgi:hypothetical protein